MEKLTGTGRISRAIRELQQTRSGDRTVTTTPNARVLNTTRGVIVDPVARPARASRGGSKAYWA